MPNYLGMKPALSLCLAITIPVGAHTEWMQSPEINTLEAGVLCAPETIGSAPAPGTLAGTTHIIAQDPPFITNTRRVPAVLGIGFGVKSLSADPEGIAGVTIQLTHPEMGFADVTTQNFSTSINGVEQSLTFYQFDHSYELVLGRWEFTAFSGDTLLYSVAFDVVNPRLVPELAAACGFIDLLS